MKISVTILLYFILFVVSFKPVLAEDTRISEIERDKKEARTILEEITVTDTRHKNPTIPVNTRYGTQLNVVNEEQIKEQNSYDLPSALRDVPGVMFQSKNHMGSQTSHSIYIRGRGASHPSSDFAVQFDGVPRYGALFGQVMGDGIALSTIGGIEIFKSPQPSQFGSGYASINVLPKYMTKDGYETIIRFSGGSYRTFDESIAVGLKKGPYDIYVSQSWADTDGHKAHSEAKQQSYYINSGYAFNKEWNIRFLANYVSGETRSPMPDIVRTNTNGVLWPAAEQFDTTGFFTTLTLNHHYENLSGYLKGYWNDTNFDLLQELRSNNGLRYSFNNNGTLNRSGGLRSRQEIKLYGIRAREKFLPWTGGEILLGADLDFTRLKNTQRTYSGLAVPGINGGRAIRVWDFPDTMLFSPYFALSQTIGDEKGFYFIPSTGFRYYNHDRYKDKTTPQAGVVLGYKQTRLNVQYSRGVNYPSPVVLMNMVLTNSPTANPSRYWKSIKPEVVDHYEVGLSHSWQEVASLGATVFRDRGRDRFQAYMFGPVPLQFNDPVGRYEIRGLELTGAVTPVKDLELYAGATWLQAEAKGADRIKRDRIPYTPGFQFQAGIKWQFINNFKLFMDMQHMRDLYQGTAVRSGTFNFGDPVRLRDITLVNARISYKFNYNTLRITDSEVFVTLNNIFNQEYEYARGYGMPGTTFSAGFMVKFH